MLENFSKFHWIVDFSTAVNAVVMLSADCMLPVKSGLMFWLMTQPYLEVVVQVIRPDCWMLWRFGRTRICLGPALGLTVTFDPDRPGHNHWPSDPDTHFQPWPAGLWSLLIYRHMKQSAGVCVYVRARACVCVTGWRWRHGTSWCLV